MTSPELAAAEREIERLEAQNAQLRASYEHRAELHRAEQQWRDKAEAERDEARAAFRNAAMPDSRPRTLSPDAVAHESAVNLNAVLAEPVNSAHRQALAHELATGHTLVVSVRNSLDGHESASCGCGWKWSSDPDLSIPCAICQVLCRDHVQTDHNYEPAF